MKFLIAILSVITLNIAQANVGTLESFFTPSLEKNDQKVVHLWMQNNCNQTVYVATKSESPQRIWETKGFMRIYPGELIRVGDLINEM